MAHIIDIIIVVLVLVDMMVMGCIECVGWMRCAGMMMIIMMMIMIRLHCSGGPDGMCMDMCIVTFISTSTSTCSTSQANCCMVGHDTGSRRQREHSMSH